MGARTPPEPLKERQIGLARKISRKVWPPPRIAPPKRPRQSRLVPLLKRKKVRVPLWKVSNLRWLSLKLQKLEFVKDGGRGLSEAIGSLTMLEGHHMGFATGAALARASLRASTSSGHCIARVTRPTTPLSRPRQNVSCGTRPVRVDLSRGGGQAGCCRQHPISGPVLVRAPLRQGASSPKLVQVVEKVAPSSKDRRRLSETPAQPRWHWSCRLHFSCGPPL